METHFSPTESLRRSARTAVHDYPVEVLVIPQLRRRNRLTAAFRIILAIPHLLLVGGPIAFATVRLRGSESPRLDVGVSAGALGAVAALAAIIAWFLIVFSGRHPDGLWNLAAYYMRWRVRAVAYFTLLRDEYPPFGDGNYPAALKLGRPYGDRPRLSVALRPVLVIPHIVVLWVLGIAWAVTTLIAWLNILIFARYPHDLYTFGVGVLRWSSRVEAYILLLCDEYPPFSLE
jgi:hypothetical protein